MPTYEYGCDACGNEWELEQRISADPVKKCPRCGKLKARRMISGGNFILKGSGWYADLYSSSKPSSGGGKDKKEAAGSIGEAKGEAKSETKTETKTETKSESKTESSKPAKKAANE